jgi:hypothetical protein
MTVTSRNHQVITGRAAREGARERVCSAQKNRSPRRKWPGTTSCASRPSAGIDRAKRLISLKATGEIVRQLCRGRKCCAGKGEREWHMEQGRLGGGPSANFFSLKT